MYLRGKKNIFSEIDCNSKKSVKLCIDNYRSAVIAFLPDARDSGFSS